MAIKKTGQTTLVNSINEIKGKLKSSYDLSNEDVGKNISEVTDQFFITSFKHALNNIPEYDIVKRFIGDPLEYGYGMRNIQLGWVVGENYDPSKRYYADENRMVDKVEKVNYENQILYRLTINKPQMQFWFKDGNSFEEYFVYMKEHLTKSILVDYVNFIQYIFGMEESNLFKPLPPDYKKTGDLIKQHLKRTIALTNKSYKDVVLAIKNEALKMEKTMLPTNSWDTANTEIPVQIPRKNQILIMSYEDKLPMETFTIPDTFNPDFYKLEGYVGNIYYLNIPKGTAYLLDDRLFRIRTRLKYVKTTELANMTHDIYNNIWNTVNVIPSMGGVKFTFTIKQ